jgi:hypothetical protein
MVLEIYYLDYKSAINYSEELTYVNTNPSDPAKAKTTMNNGLLYNTNGTVGGSVEIINFIREVPNSAFVTSMFSISTNNGLLCFNVVRKYDSSKHKPPGNSLLIRFIFINYTFIVDYNNNYYIFIFLIKIYHFSGGLCLQLKYDSSYNPINDVIVSQSCYASSAYLSNNNVTMIIQTVGDFPNLVFKISLVYGL